MTISCSAQPRSIARIATAFDLWEAPSGELALTGSAANPSQALLCRCSLNQRPRQPWSSSSSSFVPSGALWQPSSGVRCARGALAQRKLTTPSLMLSEKDLLPISKEQALSKGPSYRSPAEAALDIAVSCALHEIVVSECETLLSGPGIPGRRGQGSTGEVPLDARCPFRGHCLMWATF